MSEIYVRQDGDVIISGHRVSSFGHFPEWYEFNLSDHFRKIIADELSKTRSVHDEHTIKTMRINADRYMKDGLA